MPAAATAGVLPFRYNDLNQLAELLEAHAGRVAAIILTPIGHDFDAQIETPAPGILEGVRRLADAHQAVLIFDEVRTGFRVHLGGAQALHGVTPDLTALGKALSNGYPVTALVGSAAVMASAERTFISSTYFPNGMEMAAALATLELLEAEDVPATLARRGDTLRGDLQEIIDRRGLPVSQSPYAQMPFLYFDPALAGDQAGRRDRFYGALAAQPHFDSPQLRQVMQPSRSTTAFTLQRPQRLAPAGNGSSSPDSPERAVNSARFSARSCRCASDSSGPVSRPIWRR